MAEYIFVIYSCKKNLDHAKQMYDFYFSNSETMNDLQMKVLILYGDTTISSDFMLIENKYLVLNVEDSYECLNLKTLKLAKAIYTLYPSIIGCFKCDDDVIINMNSLIYFVKTFNINNKLDYAGHVCVAKESESNNLHLNNKNIFTIANIKTPMSLYCGGPLYYISRKSVECINKVNVDEVKDFFYEDLTVGYILNQHQIYPIQSFLYNDSIYSFNDYSYHNTTKKHTIFIRIHGGLGNQIFQICSGVALSVKYNMNYLIVNSSSVKTSFTHIDDNNILMNTIFKTFNQIDFAHINLNCISHYKEHESNCFTYNESLTFGDNDIYLDGYFQNEKYFQNNKQQLIKSLKENSAYTDFVKSINININFIKNSYFIHVRRGDYLNTNLYTIDYNRYYKSAIDVVLQKDPHAHFFIVSDDIRFCKSYQLFAKIQKTFIELPTLDTLYLMSLCEKGGICANSTFSWWGSYLNENPKKTVIFPGKWINKPWKNDIYYKGSYVLSL